MLNRRVLLSGIGATAVVAASPALAALSPPETKLVDHLQLRRLDSLMMFTAYAIDPTVIIVKARRRIAKIPGMMMSVEHVVRGDIVHVIRVDLSDGNRQITYWLNHQDKRLHTSYDVFRVIDEKDKDLFSVGCDKVRTFYRGSDLGLYSPWYHADGQRHLVT